MPVQGENPRLDRIPGLDSFLKEEHPVLVKNTDGNEVKGNLIELTNESVIEVPADWDDDADHLYDFWRSVQEVDPDDRMARVTLGGSEYGYPISRVYLRSLADVPMVGSKTKADLIQAGHRNQVDLAHADLDELVEVNGVGPGKARAMKEYVSGLEIPDEEELDSVECSVDGCFERVEEDEFYDHMIGEHGWYDPSLDPTGGGG